jgi:hypothetical protein
MYHPDASITMSDFSPYFLSWMGGKENFGYFLLQCYHHPQSDTITRKGKSISGSRD